MGAEVILREQRLTDQREEVLRLAERQQAHIAGLTSTIRRLAGRYRRLKALVEEERRSRAVEARAADVLLGAALDILADRTERT